MKRPSRLFILVLIGLLALTFTACGRRDRSARWETEPAAHTAAAANQAGPTTATALEEPTTTPAPDQPNATLTPTETRMASPTQDLSADPLAQELLNLLGQLESENAQGDAFGDLP